METTNTLPKPVESRRAPWRRNRTLGLSVFLAVAIPGAFAMVVVVVDRAGFVLGVFRTQNAPATAIGNFGQVQDANDVAVALARTGAFFSNDQAPLSSRTVRFISGIHFPPGVMNQPPADLYGIENT